VLISGFPNLIMLAGPQIAATNFPRGVELAVDWATPFLQHLWQHGHDRFDVDEAAEAAWVEHVKQMYQGLLLRKAKSWITGYNSNVDGHEYGKTRYNIYNGGAPKYAQWLREVEANGYDGIRFS
jgi:hypothetical protein